MDGFVVLVPQLPGPLARLSRDRDELDELLDDLLPDTDEGPGPFDIALIVIGGGLIAWGVIAGSTTQLVIGLIAIGLGCVLPARSLWRRVARRRQAQGLPLRVSGPVERLVRSYDELIAMAALPDDQPAVAAAHSALVEVASLLIGRAPVSAAEREYVEQRTAAIEQLTSALRGRPGTDALDSAVVLRARKELEAVAGYNSLNWLGELTAELGTRRAGD